ncbi:hypothetical protein ACJ41O_007570 [Fusarium nematophilum]
MPPQSVVIVRAGVLGLTTAAVLQDNHLRLRITIVAAEVPLVPPFPEAPRPSPEYASMWAGAHFHPDGQSNDEHQLVLHTAGVMRRLARRSPEPGVQSVIGRAITEYTPNSKAHMRTGDVYACAESDDFRIPGTQERNPGGEWGCEYQAWIANVHIYCRWLLTHFIRQGGDKIQKRLSTLEEAFQVVESSSSCPPLVINCSGRNFDTDPRCKVIRGQTVLVRNAYHKTATRHNKDDSWSLGNRYQAAGDKGHPRGRSQVLADFVSKVEDFEVVAINDGRRPWRDGGLRIEREKLRDGRTVVHGYGVGARGYELSWGAAERIVGLVSQELGDTAKL